MTKVEIIRTIGNGVARIVHDTLHGQPVEHVTLFTEEPLRLVAEPPQTDPYDSKV